MNKIKLLFFINTLSGGGAEKVLVDLLNQLDKEKYDIQLVTIEGGVHKNRLTNEIKHKQLLKDSTSFWGKLKKSFFYHLPAKVFASIFLKGDFDYEIAYLEGFPTQVIAEHRTKAKKFAFVHCDFSSYIECKSQEKKIGKAYKNSKVFEKICFVAEQAQKGFVKVFGNISNAQIVRNIINVDEIRLLAKRNDEVFKKNAGLKLTASGRLLPVKGFDRLIKAVGALEKKYNFELLILGDGEQRSTLEKIIKEENIRSVRLLGFQTNPYCIMKQADLFVCSSLSEGYSTVVTESLTLGVPVLTTDCAGMGELLKNGRYGEIVENSFEGLLNGLESILLQSEKLIQWRENIKREFTTYGIEEFERLFK